MASSGWKHQRQLQEVMREGYNHLAPKPKEPDNSLVQELVVDLVLIGIGLGIYIQFDVKPFLPFNLPDVIQNLRPVAAMVGLALAAMGGIRMLVALFESATWLIGKLFRRNKNDS